MPASPSEPEKYSIDEMMDRLKNSAAENSSDGELVTRSDGSQAIRVRKRKRRSSQPLKEDAQRTRRARIVQVSAALVLVFLAALTFGGAIIFANSSPFRDGLKTKIAQASGASVELEQFRMNPQTANANNLSLNWPDGNVLKSLTLRGLNAEIFPSSFLGNSMNGEEISVSDGILTLQVPTPGQALRNTAKPEGLLPIRFNRYRVPKLDLIVGEPTAPAIKLLKSEASLYPETVNRRSQMRLNRGDLFIPGWPKLRVDRALFEFHENEINIIGLRFHHESDDRGSLELSGTVLPYEPDHLTTLAVELDAFEFSGISGPALGRLFSGRIDSRPTADSNYLAFRPTSNPAPVLDIAFRTTPTSSIEVQGFPFLLALTQTLEDPWFERPAFEADANGLFHREGSIVSLRALSFENKGHMALRGEISMAPDKTLSGNLEVGVAEAMIVSSKSQHLKWMFGPTRDGFRWVTLKIGGSATAPTDNFKDLYSAAAAAPQDQASPDANQGSTFEELTRPR